MFVCKKIQGFSRSILRVGRVVEHNLFKTDTALSFFLQA